MVVSKVNREDAQEMLEALQQSGEGWYRQVALAVRMNAHTSLGLTTREFAQKIGQKLVNSRQAIIELSAEMKYRGKPNIEGIAAVLNLSTGYVEKVLAEEGLVEMTPRRQAIAATGDSKAKAIDSTTYEDAEVVEEDEAEEYDADELLGTIEDLEGQIEDLNSSRKGDVAKHKREVKELQEKISKFAKEKIAAIKKARADAEAELTDQERERIAKESEAWVQEQGDKMLQGMTRGMEHLLILKVTNSLEEAADGLRQLVSDTGGISKESLSAIERAHANFIEELNISRMSERTA